jgi:hypothetical protein
MIGPDERQEQYRGYQVTGKAVGQLSPFQSAGRIECPVAWGDYVVPLEPEGEFLTIEAATSRGLERAKAWIELNPDHLPPPREP